MRVPPRRVDRTGPSVIGLDPSVTHLGYCRLDSHGNVVRLTTIVPKKQKGMERIEYLLSELRTLMLEPGDSRFIVVREDYAYASHSSSDAVLKEFGGILEWELHKNAIPLYTVGVSQVKKCITGKGNSEKAQMMLSVYKDFGVEPGNEHEADAFGVAFTAQMLINRSAKTAPQKELIEAAVKNDDPLTKLPR